MLTGQRVSLVISLLAAWLAGGWAYRESYLSIYRTWDTNATFSHGFLILPIALWLVWQRRAALAAAEWRPSWLGVGAVLACAAAWIVGRGSGVIGVEQFAVVAMVPSLVLAILGVQATSALAFPLGFLFFSVPVGHALVPFLMQATAEVATWALQLTGVPIHRSSMYISIPSGNFQVARACSGLNYLVTGVVLGVLYSYINYTRWTKRLVSVAAFIVVPIIANGLRVYFTILVSHLTEMRYGPGTEHVAFGRVFFILVMVVMFLIGRRWRDDQGPAAPTPPPAAARAPALTLAGWAPAMLAIPAALIGPPYVADSMAYLAERLDRESSVAQLPAAAAGWRGPRSGPETWRPMFQGAREERSGAYRDDAGSRVDVFVGVYGIGTSGGSEMISYGNRVLATERKALADDRTRDVDLPSAPGFKVREQSVRDWRGAYLVWYWYMVGDRRALSEYEVKAREAVAFVSRRVISERVITLATPMDGAARQRLHSFVIAHALCIDAGLTPGACGG